MVNKRNLLCLYVLPTAYLARCRRYLTKEAPWFTRRKPFLQFSSTAFTVKRIICTDNAHARVCPTTKKLEESVYELSKIASQPKSKRSDMQELHRRILAAKPGAKMWFLDGKNDEGKIVSNPNIGYGSRTMKYADGKTRDFYQVGLSANSAGISVYIPVLDDKTYLARTYGKKLGKASVTGYCIKFKSLKDINVEVLEDAIRSRFEANP
jgi:hypothetical protein